MHALLKSFSQNVAKCAVLLDVPLLVKNLNGLVGFGRESLTALQWTWLAHICRSYAVSLMLSRKCPHDIGRHLRMQYLMHMIF